MRHSCRQRTLRPQPSTTQPLDDLETFFLIQGRAFIREVFQEKLQERIEQSEADDTLHAAIVRKTTIATVIALPARSGLFPST